MHCKYPIVLSKNKIVRCGQCIHCRVITRQHWSLRILLEAKQYQENTFLTLTYDEDNLPSDGQLNPKHFSDFLKRLRYHEKERNTTGTVRFFGCGEYGSVRSRPHYHIILFGSPSCSRGKTDFRARNGRCCDQCEYYHRVWGKGSAYSGQCTDQSAEYVAGYTLKKAYDPTEEMEIKEFSRMSKRPPLADGACHEIASQALKYDLKPPTSIRIGHKVYPLDLRMRKSIAKYMGQDYERLSTQNEEMQELSKSIFDVEKNVFATKAEALRQAIIEKNKFKLDALERKAKRKMANETL